MMKLLDFPVLLDAVTTAVLGRWQAPWLAVGWLSLGLAWPRSAMVLAIGLLTMHLLLLASHALRVHLFPDFAGDGDGFGPHFRKAMSEVAALVVGLLLARLLLANCDPPVVSLAAAVTVTVFNGVAVWLAVRVLRRSMRGRLP